MHATNAAIITGATRGIGLAVARRLAQEGPVVIVGRDAEALAAAAREIAAQDAGVETVVGDVRDRRTAQRAIEACESRGWRPRVMVSNAGIGKGGPTHAFDPALWRETFEVNVDGAFHFTQAVLPSMRAAKDGVIVLMASVAGVKGYAHVAAYTASKHALVGFARSLAKEYGKEGIVAVPVCPGYVDTDMTARTVRGVMERHNLSEEDARARIAQLNPQRRIIPAEEVAEAVAFICGAATPSLSGEPFMMSGGE